MYKITIHTDSGDMVGKASHGWDVLAKLGNAMVRGHTDFDLRPVSASEAAQLNSGPV